MGYKLFTSIIFEKQRFLALFILLITITLTILSIQVINLSNTLTENRIPDIVVKGKMDEDGVLRYKYYNDMPGFTAELKQKLGSSIEVYGITARSMCTMQDPLTNSRIEYTIYGVEQDFINKELSPNIADGSIPDAGQNEVIMGTYAKQFYKLSPNDKINQPITLKKDWSKDDLNRYTLSGVLNENMNFFRGAIFLAKETYDKNFGPTEDNLVFIYVNNEEDYNKALSLVYEIRKNNSAIGPILMNYYSKQMAKRNTIVGCVFAGIVCLTLILLLIAYLMKGISKKIGILKALGISNRYIIKVFMGGLLITLLVSSALSTVLTYAATLFLNYNISKFLGYKVEEYMMTGLSITSNLIFIFVCFTAIFISIYKYNMKISPNEAMTKE